eukprot:scaffold87567_cov43-Attheya_sp.AAC.1
MMYGNDENVAPFTQETIDMNKRFDAMSSPEHNLQMCQVVIPNKDDTQDSVGDSYELDDNWDTFQTLSEEITDNQYVNYPNMLPSVNYLKVEEALNKAQAAFTMIKTCHNAAKDAQKRQVTSQSMNQRCLGYLAKSQKMYKRSVHSMKLQAAYVQSNVLRVYSHEGTSYSKASFLEVLVIFMTT